MERNIVFMKQYSNSVLKGCPFRGKYDQDFLSLKNQATFLRVATESVELSQEPELSYCLKKQKQKNWAGKGARESRG